MVSRRWFDVFRLAGQTASRAVSLFLDGDVSFLPDNSFPSHIQLLEVCPCVDLCTRVTADILRLLFKWCHCLIVHFMMIRLTEYMFLSLETEHLQIQLYCRIIICIRHIVCIFHH